MELSKKTKEWLKLSTSNKGGNVLYRERLSHVVAVHNVFLATNGHIMNAYLGNRWDKLISANTGSVAVSVNNGARIEDFPLNKANEFNRFFDKDLSNNKYLDLIWPTMGARKRDSEILKSLANAFFESDQESGAVIRLSSDNRMITLENRSDNYDKFKLELPHVRVKGGIESDKVFYFDLRYLSIVFSMPGTFTRFYLPEKNTDPVYFIGKDKNQSGYLSILMPMRAED